VSFYYSPKLIISNDSSGNQVLFSPVPGPGVASVCSSCCLLLICKSLFLAAMPLVSPVA
jgi:hypothetical protein